MAKTRKKGMGDSAGETAKKVAQLPVKGIAVGLRALLKPVFQRYPWLKWVLILLPIVMLLSFLGPAAGLLGRVLDAAGAILKPLLESQVGRFVVVNVLLILLGWLLWRFARGKIRRLLGAYLLTQYLEGLSLLLTGKKGRAARRFKSALRWSSWLDLSQAVPELPHIRGDAALRLAMIALSRNRINEALASLLKVQMKDLPPESRSSFREIMARAYAQHPTLGREAIDQKLEDLLAEEPKNPCLLRLVRTSRAKQGQWESAAQAQKTLVNALPGDDRSAEEKRLATLYLKAGRESYGAKAPDKARDLAQKALKVWPELESARILLGDLAMDRGSPEKALKLWAKAPGLLALSRLEMLTSEGLLDDEAGKNLSPRALARSFPYAGVLVILARHWSDRGELRKARNALKKLMAMGDRSARVLTLYASVLERLGEKDDAALACRDALSSMLGLPLHERVDAGGEES